jgi:hypothetical protein
MTTTKAKKTLPLDTRTVLAAALEHSHKTKADFARAAGMDPPSFHAYLRPDGSSMSTATLTRVLKANGIKARIVFEQ